MSKKHNNINVENVTNKSVILTGNTSILPHYCYNIDIQKIIDLFEQGKNAVICFYKDKTYRVFDEETAKSVRKSHNRLISIPVSIEKTGYEDCFDNVDFADNLAQGFSKDLTVFDHSMNPVAKLIIAINTANIEQVF